MGSNNATGFEALKDADLILCINLLSADAQSYEMISEVPDHQWALSRYAAERRALATRMSEELGRREKASGLVP